MGSGNAVETEEGYPGVLLLGWTVKPWNPGCWPGSQVSLFLLLNLMAVLLKKKIFFFFWQYQVLVVTRGPSIFVADAGSLVAACEVLCHMASSSPTRD